MGRFCFQRAAGAGGGLVASIATCPLDVVKTKLQAQRAVQGQEGYQGSLTTVRTILRDYGIRGLYRGLGPTILGYLPTWAIYFAVYDGIKSYFGAPPLANGGGPVGEKKIYPAAQVKGYQPLIRDHSWSIYIFSAMTAGAISTICTNPLWVIKTRFMTQMPGEIRYKHTLDAALTIYRTEGLNAFYRGLLPSLLGIAHVAVQFPLYEQLKIWAKGDSDKPLSSEAILACTAVSKMTASIATYPHEVIRTRLQTQKRPIADDMSSDGMIKRYTRGGVIYTVKKVVRKEGWRALYKGLSVNLLRTVPNSAVTMLTYELLMRHLAALDVEKAPLRLYHHPAAMHVYGPNDRDDTLYYMSAHGPPLLDRRGQPSIASGSFTRKNGHKSVCVGSTVAALPT
ncbi:mitochondrial NAD+ transporter [Coprinopsis cinerea okayama7|uniref:Mitochondrial NAD+ transporter n=1 Tax=Coprinopsis cinerea (strain Okayama-7 / 130 / ATCC MYA-4618 / FGSC 9003) TaxID=240176 RepID=D6RP36_COPC7|nr:mitochondrial NAD+ transporter [Coprinopsis cinerea okayama7\|eukprot:XP_002910717.1 mitochondrial NAD+ transporter [Coprinopsis cinerea okayama7\